MLIVVIDRLDIEVSPVSRRGSHHHHARSVRQRCGLKIAVQFLGSLMEARDQGLTDLRLAYKRGLDTGCRSA